MKNGLFLAASILISASFMSCARFKSQTVDAIETESSEHKLLVPPASTGLSQHITSSSTEVKSKVTFNKDQIFGREFLYGADLQHSTLYSESSQLYDQVYALGHEIAFFRKTGSELQFVADQSWRFESDVNKPERLINSFPILAEDEKTITVMIAHGSPVLRQMFWTAAPKDQTRHDWVRSVEFDPNGNYLLIESSSENLQGEIVEHLESIFPRDTLVTKDTVTLLKTDSLAERFLFLSNDKAYRPSAEGRTQAEAAVKFNMNANTPVKWWVTSNVPDDIMLDVKNSVEGWNRYFNKMWGKPGLIFAGKLPENVKLGDPRYNVIVWDNVQDGNAAYESQAADPITGIQSHSNIYIPFSWLKIAKEYWTDAQWAKDGSTGESRVEAQKKLMATRLFFDRPLKVNCMRDLNDMILLKDKDDAALHTAAREVLKAVIMHEVGHGLGMDHNFKGSLSYDLSKKVTSSSVMDYNHYYLEEGFFAGIDSADGPLLEYDRQFLDALYNNASTIKDSPVMAACNDEDTDRTAGGVDPLCSRYDAGSDPFSWMTQTRALVETKEGKIDHFVSLAEALKRTPYNLGPAQNIKTEAEFNSAVAKFHTQQKGLMNFYFTVGAQSLRYVTQVNLKALKGFEPDVLKDTPFKDMDLRKMVAESLNYIFGLQDIPAAAKEVLQLNFDQLQTWAQGTGYYMNSKTEDQTKIVEGLTKSRTDTLNSVLGDKADNTFTKMRTRLVGMLTNDEKNSYHYSSADGVDYEKYIIDTLQKVAGEKAAGLSNRSLAERTAALTSLKTFTDTFDGADALSTLKSILETEVRQAKTADERSNSRKLLLLLKEDKEEKK